MNWSRGVFRAWILVSMAWVCLVSLWAYQPLVYGPTLTLGPPTPAQVEACLSTAQRSGKPGFGCRNNIPVPMSSNEVWDYRVDVIRAFAPLALGPVFLLFILGRALIWITAGFKNENSMRCSPASVVESLPENRRRTGWRTALVPLPPFHASMATRGALPCVGLF